MAESNSKFNLKITKGDQSFLFLLEESAIDFLQQAGPSNSLPTLLSFLQGCIQDGSINMNTDELYDKKTKLLVSIPERDINYAVPINTENVINSVSRVNSSLSDCSKKEQFKNNEQILDTVVRESSNSSDDINDEEVSTLNTTTWTDGMTKFMLDKYGKLMNYIGPMKKFKKKIDMWKQISTDIENEFGIKFTYMQVENRYKTVCKRKKMVINNNRQTGASRIDDPYESEWNQIANNDDSILPEVLRSTTNVVINQKEFESKPKKPKLESPQMLLLQFLKEKEAQKERRHQEKMDLIKKLFDK